MSLSASESFDESRLQSACQAKQPNLPKNAKTFSPSPSIKRTAADDNQVDFHRIGGVWCEICLRLSAADGGSFLHPKTARRWEPPPTGQARRLQARNSSNSAAVVGQFPNGTDTETTLLALSSQGCTGHEAVSRGPAQPPCGCLKNRSGSPCSPPALAVFLADTRWPPDGVNAVPSDAKPHLLFLGADVALSMMGNYQQTVGGVAAILRIDKRVIRDKAIARQPRGIHGPWDGQPQIGDMSTPLNLSAMPNHRPSGSDSSSPHAECGRSRPVDTHCEP
ncbi:hypothetical protein QBC47DRAFT_355410 [Echria macrotheca]|uniref:Uncharacterized protein n=1 Tax=Echria macrotheca TaxID=438768 RepID=A0AAJ0BNC4_9PEZI|nr:hypothetical protein QBC47DRAFT_355410 [Echria macrotheca]